MTEFQSIRNILRLAEVRRQERVNSLMREILKHERKVERLEKELRQVRSAPAT